MDGNPQHGPQAVEGAEKLRRRLPLLRCLAPPCCAPLLRAGTPEIRATATRPLDERLLTGRQRNSRLRESTTVNGVSKDVQGASRYLGLFGHLPYTVFMNVDAV